MISMHERNITGNRPDVIMKLGMARTFQNIRLFGTMSALENVMVGQNSRMKAGLFGSIFRFPVMKEEKAVHEKAHEELEYVGRQDAATTTGWRSTSPTATSAVWRSPARWPRTRRSSCSTSPPRG